MLQTSRKLDNQHMVLIPQKEYAKFLLWQKSIKEFIPTAAEKRALARARRNFVAKKYLTSAEFKHALGLSRRS